VDSKGPVFFKHMRVGKNRKPLPTYKFRTMVTNAEELLKTLTPEQKKEYEENFKLENDPRITKIGKILRKTSLDELPQLLNIIIGNMSVVGPRPVVQKELEKFGDQVDKLLSVTPGLTGYWQANGRSNTTYEERVAMELYYVDHCSIWLDIKIIFQTIGAVIRKEGAK
ncbi:sugar transferase, partial [Absiella sp. AM09-50]